MTFQDYLTHIRHKKIAVIGVGVSNRPLVKLLCENGADVTVCDKKTEEKLGDYAQTLREMGVSLRLGENYLDNLDEPAFDYIFRTPGLRPDHPGILKGLAKGAKLTSEMEVFFSVCPCPIIAVTGSEGKTTTTTLIAEMLRRAGKTVFVGGNIGTPLLAKTPEMKHCDVACVELSSFQLMSMPMSAHTAVVKNVTPNHLDYHKGMEEYIDAKRNVFRWQNKNDTLVLNWDNEVTRAYAKEAKGKVVWFSIHDKVEEGVYLDDDTLMWAHDGKTVPVLKKEEIRIPGMHNVENFATAIATVFGQVPTEEIAPFAREFGGVEHRIEFVREFEGVRYFNDSIATAPTRVIAGLHAFDQKLILICGGYDKKIPFDVLGSEFVAHVKGMVLCGVTAPKIRAAVENAPGYNPQDLPIVEVDDFKEAVYAAKAMARPGDVVSLSPACAAFDKFDNFEHRGRVYKEIVRNF